MLLENIKMQGCQKFLKVGVAIGHNARSLTVADFSSRQANRGKALVAACHLFTVG